MKFQVMSRANARRHSFRSVMDDCLIISISEKDADPNRFHNNPHIKGVCRLHFDDVEGGNANSMTRADAEKIIQFVNENMHKADEIIVHCFAGVSRSAGVCAALMLIMTGSDMEIFNNPRFCPNMHCYRTMLETYYGSYTEAGIEDQYKNNIEAWKAANS